MIEIYKTAGNLPKIWVKTSETANHLSTFTLLEWSKDCIGERGVMFLTETKTRDNLTTTNYEHPHQPQRNAERARQ